MGGNHKCTINAQRVGATSRIEPTEEPCRPLTALVRKQDSLIKSLIHQYYCVRLFSFKKIDFVLKIESN